VVADRSALRASLEDRWPLARPLLDRAALRARLQTAPRALRAGLLEDSGKSVSWS
jgi:hypothetical protein